MKPNLSDLVRPYLKLKYKKWNGDAAQGKDPGFNSSPVKISKLLCQYIKLTCKVAVNDEITVIYKLK